MSATGGQQTPPLQRSSGADEKISDTSDVPAVSAVLTHADGLIFDLCLAGAFMATDKQPQTTSADDECQATKRPQATVSFLGRFRRGLDNLHADVIASAFGTIHFYTTPPMLFIYIVAWFDVFCNGFPYFVTKM